jgi:ribosome modulation factor
MGNPYEQGQEAFVKGLSADANPYKEQAENQKAWQEGWEDAKIEADLKRRAICADRREPNT